MEGHMSRRKRVTAGLLSVCALAAALVPAAAIADPPKFNPGQKGQVCQTPGPNANPNCVPG
jgi:hypothetical protein